MNEQLHGSYDDVVARSIGVITKEEQEKLKKSHVGLLGAGGVGGLTSILLAKIGFGKITIYDRDIYEVSNLNRQMLATTDTVDSKKAEVAGEVLPKHNPHVDVNSHAVYLTSDQTIEEAFKDVDIIIVAVDNMSTIVRIKRAIEKLNIPMVITGPFGWKFFATVVDPQGPDYEQLTGAVSQGKEVTDEIAALLDLYQRGFVYHTGGFTEDMAQKMRSTENPIVTFAPTVNATSCAGIMEAVKVLTGRGTIHSFPNYYTLDLLTGEPWSVHETGMKLVEEFKAKAQLKGVN